MLVRCSSDDYPLVFSPPDWIKGKWIKADDSNTLNSITFTDRDIILDIQNGPVRSSSEFVQNNDEGGIDVFEDISDTEYITTLKYRVGGFEDIDRAVRVSEIEILYNNESYMKD